MRVAFIVGLLSCLLACQPADTDSVVVGNSKPDRYAIWASYAGSTDSAQFSSLHQILYTAGHGKFMARTGTARSP